MACAPAWRGARSGSPTRARSRCGSMTRAPISAGPWRNWTSSCVGCNGSRDCANPAPDEPTRGKPPNPHERHGQRRAGAMAKQAFPYDFSELTKMMQDYQVPGVDWQELIASQQKNVEALTRANQVLFEGAQAVIQREVEIMQKAMQEFAEA